jgi:hypothetical protein
MMKRCRLSNDEVVKFGKKGHPLTSFQIGPCMVPEDKTITVRERQTFRPEG